MSQNGPYPGQGWPAGGSSSASRAPARTNVVWYSHASRCCSAMASISAVHAISRLSTVVTAVARRSMSSSWMWRRSPRRWTVIPAAPAMSASRATNVDSEMLGMPVMPSIALTVPLCIYLVTRDITGREWTAQAAAFLPLLLPIVSMLGGVIVLFAVKTVRADGSRMRTVTRAPGHYVEPQFSADGRSIVYRRVAGDEVGTALALSVAACASRPKDTSDDLALALDGRRRQLRQLLSAEDRDQQPDHHAPEQEHGDAVLRHQVAEQVGNVAAVRFWRQGFDRGEVESSGEDAQPGEEVPGPGREELMTPLHRRGECGVPDSSPRSSCARVSTSTRTSSTSSSKERGSSCWIVSRTRSDSSNTSARSSKNERGMYQVPEACEPRANSSVFSRETGSSGIQKDTFCMPSMQE